MKNYPDVFAVSDKKMIKRPDGTFALYSSDEVAKLTQEGKIKIEYPMSKGGRIADLTQKPVLVLNEWLFYLGRRAEKRLFLVEEKIWQHMALFKWKHKTLTCIIWTVQQRWAKLNSCWICSVGSRKRHYNVQPWQFKTTGNEFRGVALWVDYTSSSIAWVSLDRKKNSSWLWYKSWNNRFNFTWYFLTSSYCKEMDTH